MTQEASTAAPLREREALEEIARLAQRMIDDPLPSAVHDALRIRDKALAALGIGANESIEVLRGR